MKLSEKIITSRKKQGLAQVDLADALGVSRQSISKWETDESKPDINKLPALAKTLGVSIDWLLSEEDVEENKEESFHETVSMSEETVVKAYPDWVDKAPGFIGAAIKKYGWIYGVRFIVAGAIFTLFGIVARVMSYNFIFGAKKVTDSLGPFDNIGMNPDIFEDTLSFGGSAFTEINNQAWGAFSTMTGLIIGVGVIMLIGGIVLTVILRRWAKKA